MNGNLYDAVVFDYGCVLSLAPSAADLRDLAALVGMSDTAAFFELYSNTREAYDAGREDCMEHWQHFAQVAGIELAPPQIAQIHAIETRMWTCPNLDTLRFAEQIRARGVRTAILSNIPFDLLNEVRRRFEWLKDFPVKIWSCEIGVTKPAPGIYRACIETLDCEPGRILFLDDRPRNVEAARRAGMQAHIFESAEQARSIVLPQPVSSVAE